MLSYKEIFSANLMKLTLAFKIVILMVIFTSLIFSSDVLNRDEWDYYQEGLKALSAGDISGYLDNLEKACEMKPDEQEFIYHHARAYGLNGKSGQAANFLKKITMVYYGFFLKSDAAFKTVRDQPEIKEALDYLDKLEMSIEKVDGSVYILTGQEANIAASIGDDGILLVDSGFVQLIDFLKAALKKVSDKEIRYLINTHWHPDHTRANTALGPSVPIIAHTNCRKRLSEEQKLLGRPSRPLGKEGLPVIVIDKPISIFFNGEEIRVIPLEPGHSDGDLVVYFTGSKVLVMGGSFYSGMLPFMDEVWQNASLRGLLRSVEMLINEMPSDIKIIPGHGPLSTIEDLKSYRDMLSSTYDFVKEKVKYGKSLDEIKNEGLPEKYRSWQQQFMQDDGWLEFLYENIIKDM